MKAFCSCGFFQQESQASIFSFAENFFEWGKAERGGGGNGEEAILGVFKRI